MRGREEEDKDRVTIIGKVCRTWPSMDKIKSVRVYFLR